MSLLHHSLPGSPKVYGLCITYDTSYMTPSPTGNFTTHTLPGLVILHLHCAYKALLVEENPPPLECSLCNCKFSDGPQFNNIFAILCHLYNIRRPVNPVNLLILEGEYTHAIINNQYGIHRGILLHSSICKINSSMELRRSFGT